MNSARTPMVSLSSVECGVLNARARVDSNEAKGVRGLGRGSGAGSDRDGGSEDNVLELHDGIDLVLGVGSCLEV